MKKLWVISVFLLYSSLAWCADVLLTEDQFTELTEIMDQLETVNNGQKQTINELKTQSINSEQTIQQLEKELNEQKQIQTELKNSYEEEKKSSDRRWIMTTIDVGTIMLVVGLVIGALML